MPEIDQALDILDGLELRQLQELRYHVSRTVRAALASRVGTATSQHLEATSWPAVERALFYVLWTTSTEYLEQALITPAQ
jgi:hypothetical protein